MLTPFPRTAQMQAGSALLEGLLAILIFSLGILGLIGLQSASMKNATLAKMRIDASLIADERIGKIWVDRAHIMDYAETSTTVTALPGGKRTTVVNGTDVTVTVSWAIPGDSMAHNFRTVAHINGND